MGFEPAFVLSNFFFHVLFMYMWEWTALSINFICILDFVLHRKEKLYSIWGCSTPEKACYAIGCVPDYIFVHSFYPPY